MSARDVNEPSAALEPLLREGDILDGRYAIGPRLGGGGMASVFRATHLGLDQPVAVKILSPLIRDVPGMASRFLQEARAATRLKSEHVVRVFDVGTKADGVPYMVMELLEGKDLGQLLDEGLRPSVEEAIDYVLQACEALAEVHGVGIVHRDLKPANLFVTRGPDGLACIKLIDFGISREGPTGARDPLGSVEPPPRASGAAENGAPVETLESSGWGSGETVMGSPRYMAPEQMESAAAADSRSDIWGLGAILYEMLVGHAPFDGESLFDIYAAAVRCPPPAPSRLRSGLPARLDDAVLRCLRVDPGERHADVAELAAALAPLGDEDAAVRAESVARVLDNARSRSRGDTDAANGHGGAAANAPAASKVRKRVAAARASRRRSTILLGAAAVAVIGVGLAARPLALWLDLSPSVSVTGAAAATTAEATPAEPGASETTLTSASIAPAAGPTAAAPAPAALQGEAPSARLRRPIRVGRQWATAPDLAPASLPPRLAPDAAPSPRARRGADERTLFEDRK